MIYPNPASDHLNLLLLSALETEKTYEIINTEGKLLSKDHITTQSTSIDVSKLSNGLYLLRILPDANFIKFMVNH
ncbi:MAG: T9SS type A sorting domain-containing protein [Saprospiraceae bacterium]